MFILYLCLIILGYFGFVMRIFLCLIDGVFVGCSILLRITGLITKVWFVDLCADHKGI